MKLDRRHLEDALREVMRLCGERGLDVRIVVVGGAAMALHYKMDRDPTRDVDCVVLAAPTVHHQVFEIADEVGQRRGFLDGWFNSGARLFLPDFGEPHEWQTYDTLGDATIWIAPPEIMFAMKLLAGRPNRDFDDLETLAKILGVKTQEQAQQIFDRFYPHDDMARQSSVWIQRHFAS